MSRGGVSAVLAMHQNCASWNSHRCIWVETMNGGTSAGKLATAIKAFGRAAVLVPSAEIVHIHMALGASLYRKFMFFLLARLFNKPVILHLHCPDRQFAALMEGPSSFGRALCVWMLRNAHRVVALSDCWEQLILRYVPEARTCCLPNPYWLPSGFRASGRSGRTVLYLNRIESRKGYEHFLAAIPLVLERCPEAKFVLAGNGDVVSARRIAAQFGVEHAVEFPGWVEGDRKLQLLSTSDILCLPSFSEGVPIALLEAMGAGMAVVTTAVGGIPDVVQDEVNGILVRPGDVKGIADSLLRVLIDSQLRDRLADAGRRTVERTNALPVVDAALGNLYAEKFSVGEVASSSVATR
jgi:glycosyltransferase involved in cell wall biosynthesis